MKIKSFKNLFTALLLIVALSVTGQSGPGYGNIHTATKKDADGDGVKDKKDKCSATPAGVLVDEMGCPIDTDKDGVPDYLDKCPDLPGSEAMNGCQDKDKDGVADNEDTCPDIPGSPRFRGCPDSDGDGIEDAKDRCPNVKGSDKFSGCPDSDGDGVEDAVDKCPNTKAGIKVDVSGCPADADGDGVTDSEDKCPNTQPGVKVDEKGCVSDTDGDGVLDSEDKCPSVAGAATNKGCPVEAPKRLELAVRKINFDNGSAVLKATSYAMLDEIVSILKNYPDYNLRIGGHIDALEKDGALSTSRAEAVKTYLLSKNVPESRIEVTGYGKTRPISTKTRSLNRRAEIEFYLK